MLLSMRNIYLLALLPLSLITTGASGVTYGSPYTFLGNFKIEAPGPGSKLTVDYPDGFGSMKLSAGEMVYADMINFVNENFLWNDSTPNAVTFQTGVLSNDFSFNTAVVNAGTFKFPMYAVKDYVKTGKSVDFQAALLKTSFASGSSLSGKTAVLTFDVPSENRRGGKSGKSLNIGDLASNAVGVHVSKSDDPTKKLGFYFKMLCAKHPGTSTKGRSAACTSSEFKPYDSAAKTGSNIDKYKMSLLGSTGDYYHNTISFVPNNLGAAATLTGNPPAGSYTGNLTVTFSVE